MIKLYRSALVIFCFIFFGIGAFIISFLIIPYIKLFVKKEKRRECYQSVLRNSWKNFIDMTVRLGIIKVNIKDYEHLTNIKNKVIVATHPSFIDIVILVGLIPKSICFAKKELLHNFLLKDIVKSICISNGLELEEMKSVTKEYLDEGYNVIIFPMGRRHKQDEFPKIRKGAAVVALNSGKNIVPVKMYTDYDFLQIGQPVYDAGDKVINYYIEPMEEINIQDYITSDEVETKKNITTSVANALYSIVE